MAKYSLFRIPLLFAVVGAALLQAACGGGGDGVGSGGTGIINGAVVKGPVANATVSAYAVAGGRIGTAIGSATTDGNGNFTLPIGSYSGPLMLQASAGTFRDEATGTLMTMASSDVMTAALPSVASGAAVSGIHVTPLTSMAQTRALQMTGGMTDANIAAANIAMGNYFSVSDILRVAPMNPVLPGSGAAASTDARNYGMTLAAMSQYTLSIGLANTSALVTAMMNDASDGMMDGKNGSSPISMTMREGRESFWMAPTAGTSGLATGMTNFVMSPANKSGLTATDVAPLVQKLSSFNGKL
ncbi:MAG: carboxypeptidase-like regulatory domain-containing protein [Stagnimonas sp.]|nr:carboxypeptidase-like regulatory domain-containing protein [Stagnimonas sp.]